MKVSGFSFVKNAVKYDYPIVEAICSILPICDEFVVAVGDSDDSTKELIQSIDSEKIRIIETVWDETIREGGRVLAKETNKAFAEVSESCDWAFYIQADEVIHERDLHKIKQAMIDYKDDPQVDGLLFNYHHFFASYDYVGASSQWYRNEIRVIKNDKSIYSYRDAQGFRKGENKKLNVIPVNAHVYHYGWVKAPEKLDLKQMQSSHYGYDNKRITKKIADGSEHDYGNYVSELNLFNETHPAVMKERIAAKNWQFEYDVSLNRRRVKDTLKIFCKKYLGLDFYYKNYILRS